MQESYAENLGIDAVSAPLYAHFGAGSGQIWLDDINCAGSEDSIVNCQHSGWGSHNCNHNEDAAVVCSSKYRTQGKSWIMFMNLIMKTFAAASVLCPYFSNCGHHV